MKKLVSILILALACRAAAFSQVSATLLLPVGADSTANSKYLNFYFGALMAARDLGQDGIQINLEVIDIQSKDFPTFGNRMRMNYSDVLIGPVSTEDILKIHAILPKDKYIVSPLDTKTIGLCDSLPVIVANTPHSRQVKDAIDWTIQDHKSHLSDTAIFNPIDTILLISEANKLMSEEEKDIRERFSGIYAKTNIEYRITQGVEIIDTFNVHCHLNDSVTRCFAVSDKDIFIKDAMRQTMEQNFRKKSCIFYSSGKVRNAELSDLCAANTHMSTTFFVDYSDPKIQKFILQYRAFFGTDPDSFAFHGYDCLHYFVNMANQFGKEWPRSIDQYQESGLQTNFAFQQDTTKAGAVNDAVRRVLFSAPFNYYIVK